MSAVVAVALVQIDMVDLKAKQRQASRLLVDLIARKPPRPAAHGEKQLCCQHVVSRPDSRQRFAQHPFCHGPGRTTLAVSIRLIPRSSARRTARNRFALHRLRDVSHERERFRTRQLLPCLRTVSQSEAPRPWVITKPVFMEQRRRSRHLRAGQVSRTTACGKNCPACQIGVCHIPRPASRNLSAREQQRAPMQLHSLRERCGR